MTEGDKAVREGFRKLRMWMAELFWAFALSCILLGLVARCASAEPEQLDDMRGWLLESQIEVIRQEQGPRYVGDYRWYTQDCNGPICRYTPRFELWNCRGLITNCREVGQHE